MSQRQMNASPIQSSQIKSPPYSLALLEQCPRVPIPAELQPKGPLHPLKYLIRKQFRRNAWERSSKIIVAALKTGYETEKLLRTAGDGDLDSRNQIYELLRYRKNVAATSAQLPQPPKLKIRYPEAIPGVPKLLDVRPLPFEKLSGPRHVPIFARAMASNFLRIQKPQSPYLSRVLRDKIETRQKRIDHRLRIELLEEIAIAENIWEDIVEDQLEKEGLSVDNWNKKQPGLGWGVGDWEKDLQFADDSLKCLLSADALKVVEMSKLQLEIVDQEKELWRQERGQRRHDKKLAKLEKKCQAGHEMTTGSEI
ncbi:hypothetical protein SBOR_2154 [Sclerotinia borealis F-4128]|uniref:Uncharacterized protein n=1 Tax=Sclerotinia borealis (strain F-4128) TaxID=1432307 RepID=W9CSJ5_SCLBF|nr:hypothetical protein SBOR_2154 [Sclerotinia borealis F-4128]